jgi:hypothetical protein
MVINQCKVETFELCNDTSSEEWKLKASFDIEPEDRGYGDGIEVLTVDKGNNVIICSLNKLLVYSSSGEHIKNIQLLGDIYLITGKDNKGNVILCNFQAGKFYSINNIPQMDCNNMEQYLVCEGYGKSRDMTIDCEGNLWILHVSYLKQFCLTKRMPIK